MTLVEELHALQSQRGELTANLGDIENDIAVLKVRCGHKSPEVAAVIRRKMKLTAALSGLNTKVHLLSVRIDAEKRAAKATSAMAISVPQTANRTFIESLVELRAEYQAFSEDHTRVASMRRMASEFVGKLNAIIRAALKP